VKEKREKIEKYSEKLVELVKELRYKLGGSLGEEDHTAEVVPAKMGTFARLDSTCWTERVTDP
jgi:hypothetical protein